MHWTIRVLQALWEAKLIGSLKAKHFLDLFKTGKNIWNDEWELSSSFEAV